VLVNRTIYTLIWYAFYDLRPGSGVGPILTAPEPTQGYAEMKYFLKILQFTIGSLKVNQRKTLQIA